MKYIKDLHEDDETPAGDSKSNTKKSYWIIYKSGDESKKKVDSFEGDDDEVEEFLNKKNAEGDDKFKAWTISGIESGDDDSDFEDDIVDDEKGEE
jgi:hypothetical protein